MTARGRPSTQARAPTWSIDDVLARTDLANLLDRLGQRGGDGGRRDLWHCPVPGHQDRNPSVTMSVDHRGHERWRCWSGDGTHRGDAIDLVMVTQRLDQHQAVDWLAKDAGLAKDSPLPPPIERTLPPPPTSVPLDPAVVRYAQACERILDQPHGAPVRQWLAERGLQPEIIRANHVGADPGRQLMRRQRGLPYGRSVGATFPVLNNAGQIRYVQTRYLEPGDGPKYDNPAAALGHNPRLAWTAPVALPIPGVLAVCEGIPDALTAAQAGYRSVGVLGSQAPDATVAAKLAYQADNNGLDLVAIIDADPAGRHWGQHLQHLLADHEVPLQIVEPPEEGLDLNTWALQDPGWSADVDGSISNEPAVPDVRTVDQDHASNLGLT
jgi:DNA primase